MTSKLGILAQVMFNKSRSNVTPGATAGVSSSESGDPAAASTTTADDTTEKGLGRLQFSIGGLMVTTAIVAIASQIYANLAGRMAWEAVVTLSFFGAPLLGLYFTSIFRWQSAAKQLRCILWMCGLIGFGLLAWFVVAIAISDFEWGGLLTFIVLYLVVVTLFWSPQWLFLIERLDGARGRLPLVDEPDFSNLDP